MRERARATVFSLGKRFFSSERSSSERSTIPPAEKVSISVARTFLSLAEIRAFTGGSPNWMTSSSDTKTP